MIALVSVVMLGFFLGMRHATDPDHVIAVTTIVSRQRSMSHAALIGALWGLGHTITIFLVGSAIILFGVVIPPRLGLSMELSVGLMLILLGVLNLSGMMRWITETFTPAPLASAPPSHGHSQHTHSHTHAHGDFIHTHPHKHDPENSDSMDHGHSENSKELGEILRAKPALRMTGIAESNSCHPEGIRSGCQKDLTVKSGQTRKGGRAFFRGLPSHADDRTDRNIERWFGQLGVYQAVRPLVVGLVHGLAGSAAVALLVLTTIRVPLWAALYLLVFGVGTVAGMMLITAAMAVPLAYSEGRFTRMNHALSLASGFVSLGFGLFIVYQMGYVNGIFSAHPKWTPH